MSRSEAADHLRRMCGSCALAFLLGTVLLFIGEAAGMPREIIGGAFVLLPFALYAAVGMASPASDLPDFQVAGRCLPPAFAGIAAASAWAAPALLIGAPGSLFLAGYDGRPVLIGLTGGYVLLAVLIVPYVRNTAAHTVAELIGIRYGSVARFVAAVIALLCSLTFAAALLDAGAAIVGPMLGIDTHVAIAILAAVLLLCTLLGGMAGLAATQAAQYAVLLIGSLAVLVIFAARPYDPDTGVPYDAFSRAVDLLLQGLGLVPARSPRSVAFHAAQALDNLELTLCLMAGTAALSHVATPALSTPGMGDARASGPWTLVFIALLAFALPTFMTLANTAAEREQTGVISGLLAAIPLAAMLAGAGATVVAAASSLQDVGSSLMRPPRASPGSLIPARALVALTAIGAAVLGSYAAAQAVLEPVPALEWAFSLAAAGLFPALVLGIWWTRATTSGALAGMLAGFGISLLYLLVTRFFPQSGIVHFGMSSLADPATGLALVDVAQVLSDPHWRNDLPASAANPLASRVGWLNVGNSACGIFGLIAGFAVTAAVSRLGKGPSARRRAQIAALRLPGANNL